MDLGDGFLRDHAAITDHHHALDTELGAKFLRPGGVRAVAAESLALKHQLLICTRSRQRAPNLTTLDRLLLGLTTLCMRPHRIPKLSVMIKPATLLKFHKALVDGKHRRLFSSSGRPRKPGPKGPSAELTAAIVELKRRNPQFGCVLRSYWVILIMDVFTRRIIGFGVERADIDGIRRQSIRGIAVAKKTDPAKKRQRPVS